MKFRTTLILPAILIVSTLACGKSRMESLTDRADAYNRAVRWGSLTAAATLIAEDVRRTIVQKMSRDMASLKFVDFAIVDLGVDEARMKASVMVEYSYFHIAYQDLKYRQELQSWEYDKEKGDWFLRDTRDVQGEK